MSEPTFPTMSDGVVVLRQWVEADVPAQLAAFRDPLFVEHSDWAPTTPVEAILRLREQEQARRRGQQLDCAVVDASEPGMLLGGVSVNKIDLVNKRASLGYWLAPSGRGRGAATGAVRLIVGWALESVSLARLEITCGPDNAGSQRVARRCGFTQEGLLRSHMAYKGGRRDSLVFGLLPGELT